MGFGKFHYYSSLSPAIDSGFGYPVVEAPADKAIKLTQLSYYAVTNTTNTEINFYIVPAGSERIADGSYEIANLTAFSLGGLNVSLMPSSIISQLPAVGLPAKGAFSDIIIPAASIMIAVVGSSGNLDGTVQYRAIGYECAIGDY